MNVIKNKILIGFVLSIIVFTSSYLVFQKYMDLHNNKQKDKSVQTKITSDGASSDQDVVIQINCKCGDWCDVFGCYCNTCMGNCEVGCGSSDNLCNSGSCINDMCYISGCGCGVESCGACYGCDQADGAVCDENAGCSSGNCYWGVCEACITQNSKIICENDGECCDSDQGAVCVGGICGIPNGDACIGDGVACIYGADEYTCQAPNCGGIYNGSQTGTCQDCNNS